jgi:signal transduction histidine kinase
VVIDADGVVTSANPTAVDLLGATSQDDVVGHAAGDVLELVDDDGSLRRDRLAVGPPLDGTLRRPDGGMLPVRMAVAPLADGRGTVVVLADRTREREVDRLKGEFLANVSHELRTPLTPIRGYAELLARRHDLTPQRTAEFVAEILASTQRMHRVVELLVDVAALDAGRVQLQPEAVSVSRLADDRLEAWRASYPDRAADFARRVAPNLPPLQVDRGWLAKALDELADNAVKHAPADSPITIAATRSDDGGVRIAVRDAGPGVDRTRLPELLGDFSQADASATRQTGGLGLGLGFVTRVAQRLGLELSVDTRAGAGSEFALTIPPSAATEVSKRSRPPARHRRTTKPRRTRE